ncbi:Major facilitator superfamily like protein [Aduncisulcus paluster]|uniref:Major facilitator superfamily like protein n=1 Tax=Aduncisulcus paluster TaxID=2918883 RepID=A0ABQ5JW12_9EUKA|nr:Major facilitator superfamily like protein [Aduncisulcus paluster]
MSSDKSEGVIYKTNCIPPVKLFWALGWSSFLSGMDMSIVTTALPAMTKDLNTTEAIADYVGIAYMIGLAAFSTVAGKIGDRFGTVIVHRIGMFCFIVFSACCGIPWSIYSVIVFRAFQGLAAALLLSNNLALVAHLCTHDGMQTAMILNTLFLSAASALGPIIGGLLTEYLGWEYAFFINIPFGIIGLVACWMILPPVKKIIDSKFDIGGAIGIFVSLGVVVFGISYIEYSALIGIIVLIAGIGLFSLVLLYEAHHETPALPIPLLVNRTIVSSLIGATITFGAQACLLYQMPFLLQDTFDLTPTESGLCMLPMTIFMIVSAFLAGGLCRKYISFYTRAFSCVIQCIGLIILGLLCHTGVFAIICIMSFISIGLGGFQTSNTGFVTSAAPKNVRGVVGGLVQTFREVGFAMGTSLSACLLDEFLNLEGASSSDHTFDQMIDASSWVYFVFSLISLCSVLAAFISKASPHEINLIGHPQYDPFAKPRIGVENIELNWKKYKMSIKDRQEETVALLGEEEEEEEEEF